MFRNINIKTIGKGIIINVPPSKQIVNILDFIDTSVEDGSLTGKGPGKSGKNRLKTFIKMIETIKEHIDRQHYKPASNKIDVVLKRCDSQSSSGFVEGLAIDKLIKMLLQLKNDLENDSCKNIVVMEEAHVFNDPFPLTLDKRNVYTESIVITDATGIHVYAEGDDYAVTIVGNEAEIICTTLGKDFPNIVDGQTLLVDYIYNTCDGLIPETPEEEI